ncbi:MAG: nucleotide sugar dehydrogenase [Bacteroidetes bacterium]|nr:nucleotide sugar dehydrogenase [Bacteroidota bacterium]
METIGIIGIGKLGLCFALNLERAGYAVLGADVSDAYVNALNEKSFFSYEPQVNEYLTESKNFKATNSLTQILQSTAQKIFIMVATPSLADGSYDHSQIERVTDEIIVAGKTESKKHLVIGCTTMPGYCDKLAKKMEAYNYSVSYNPEFIAQGSIIHNQQNPSQILIGEADANAGDAIEKILKLLAVTNPVVCRMNRLSAEITKLATNCFITTKISFANSIGDLAKQSGADAEKILNAIGSDARIGNQFLQYGFGFGGPCFPRDNRALKKFAENVNADLPISEATDKVNQQHLEFQFETMLKENSVDEKIIFEGVAYKEGTVYIDESQKLLLAIKLANAGRQVVIRDSKKVIDEVRGLYPDLFIFVER